MPVTIVNLGQSSPTLLVIQATKVTSVLLAITATLAHQHRHRVLQASSKRGMAPISARYVLLATIVQLVPSTLSNARPATVLSSHQRRRNVPPVRTQMTLTKSSLLQEAALHAPTPSGVMMVKSKVLATPATGAASVLLHLMMQRTNVSLVIIAPVAHLCQSAVLMESTLLRPVLPWLTNALTVHQVIIA